MQGSITLIDINNGNADMLKKQTNKKTEQAMIWRGTLSTFLKDNKSYNIIWSNSSYSIILFKQKNINMYKEIVYLFDIIFTWYLRLITFH